jgi:hypothetical protein
MSGQAANSLASNVLDFTLAHFGPQHEQDLYEVVRSATSEDLDRFVDAYANFASRGTTRAPELQDGELRPYFPTSGQAADWTQGGFTLSRDALKLDGGDWAAVDAIKHRLLYCHSVAFDDPMGEIVTSAAAQLRLKDQGDSGMRALLNYVNLLLHFSEFLRGNIVCIVSPESYLPRYAGPRSVSMNQDMQASLKTSELPEIDEIMEAAPKNIQVQWQSELREPNKRKLLKEANLVAACERISAAIAGVSAAAGRLSLYLPFRYDVELLKRYPKPLESGRVAHFPDGDNWLLDQVIDLELPNLELLDPRDIVAIRTGSEFSAWRNVLKKALTSASAFPHSVWNREQEVRREIDDRLREGKLQMEAAISKSPVLEGVKKGAVTMLAGVASAGVTCLLNPASVFLWLLWAAGAGATVAAIAEALKTTPGPVKERTGTLAHFVAVLR